MRTRMVVIAAACVAASASLNVAMDGGGPPRVRTRAEASLSTAPGAPVATATPLLTAPARNDDPEGAARIAEMQTDPELRARAIRQVAVLWGALDADRAVNWARSLQDAAEREATLIDVANGLSSVDPARGVELREQFTVTTQPDNALSNLVQQWASYSFDDALAWTNARAPGALRDDLMQRLIYVRAAAGDPAAASRLLTDSSLSGAARIAAITSVAQEWATRDGDAAQAWVQTLEPASSN